MAALVVNDFLSRFVITRSIRTAGATVACDIVGVLKGKRRPPRVSEWAVDAPTANRRMSALRVPPVDRPLALNASRSSSNPSGRPLASTAIAADD